MRPVTWLVVTWIALQTPSVGADERASYAKLQDLPDWSGWWHIELNGPPPLPQMLWQPPPLRPKLLSQFHAMLSAVLAQGGVEYCGPPQFVGFKNGAGFEDTIEFLFTPGRVTLTTEAGLIRRIHTDGRALPDEPDETNAGTSVGRWEGDTLVVETAGLMSSARFPLPLIGAPSIGPNVHVTEHIHLTDRDRLQIDSVMIAPELMASPYEVHSTYVREAGYVAHELSYCVEGDRLVDPVTHRLRFDLTPPPDLAPPPAR